MAIIHFSPLIVANFFFKSVNIYDEGKKVGKLTNVSKRAGLDNNKRFRSHERFLKNKSLMLVTA